MSISIKFEIRDCWVGVYWRNYYADIRERDNNLVFPLRVYVCIVPLFPIIFTFWRSV